MKYKFCVYVSIIICQLSDSSHVHVCIIEKLIRFCFGTRHVGNDNCHIILVSNWLILPGGSCFPDYIEMITMPQNFRSTHRILVEYTGRLICA